MRLTHHVHNTRMCRTREMYTVVLLLPCACGVDAEASDTFSDSGPTTGAPGENSLLCAPIVEVEDDTGETGDDLPFPPDDEQPVLYTCAGDVEVDFTGRVCTCGGGSGTGDDKTCFYDIAVRPSGDGGPLTGGSLSFSTPLGDKFVGILGSSIAFRRLPCESDNCPFILNELEIEAEDFSIGPLTVTGLHAKLANPAAGIVRGDTTASIEARATLVESSFGISIYKHPHGLTPLFGGETLSIRATNDEPITLTIDDENNIAITNASFTFPSNVTVGMQTHSVNCTAEIP